MSKLLKLKEWFSFEEAAKRLSTTLDEQVAAIDLVQLVVDGHLMVYWLMQNDFAAEMVYETRTMRLPTRDFSEKKDYEITDFFQVENETVVALEGPFRVPLSCNPGIHDALVAIITRRSAELVNLDGFFLVDEAGRFWCPQERFDRESIKEDRPFHSLENYFPSGRLPEFSELGFTRSELEKFEDALVQRKNTSNKGQANRERNTLLKLIVSMAVNGYAYDPDKPKNLATKEIVDDLAKLGLSLSEDTVREKLKEGAGFLSDGWRESAGKT